MVKEIGTIDPSTFLLIMQNIKLNWHEVKCNQPNQTSDIFGTTNSDCSDRLSNNDHVNENRRYEIEMNCEITHYSDDFFNPEPSLNFSGDFTKFNQEGSKNKKRKVIRNNAHTNTTVLFETRGQDDVRNSKYNDNCKKMKNNLKMKIRYSKILFYAKINHHDRVLVKETFLQITYWNRRDKQKVMTLVRQKWYPII